MDFNIASESESRVDRQLPVVGSDNPLTKPYLVFVSWKEPRRLNRLAGMQKGKTM